LGDTASLTVDGSEEGEDEALLKAQVEISISRRTEDQPRIIFFATEQVGSLKLGVHVEDVDILAPLARVEIGPSPEAVLVAPINIQCNQLSVTANRLAIETSLGRREAAVFLEAQSYESISLNGMPTIRGNASLKASWPGVRNFPWTSFATDPAPTEDIRVDEALRRFRKFVISFRSHSKGRLARYKGKIEHERMTKGTGRKVLDRMLAEEIVSLEGPMYFLSPERLSERAGTNYSDSMARQFGQQTLSFIARALDNDAKS
jgi:hypothetical protein